MLPSTLSPCAAQDLDKGGLSAYAYEVLPLLHTLMATGRFLPARFADDALQFFAGTRGSVNAGPRQWLQRWLGANAPPVSKETAGDVKGSEDGEAQGAAGVPGDNRANALVKVRVFYWLLHALTLRRL